MRLLVRLYPRAWRERYATEFEALLDAIPLTVGVVGDVIAGSVRARLRDVAEAPIELRPAAIAGIAGGSLWASTFALGSAVEWGRYGTDLGTLFLIAAAAVLLVAQAAMPPAAGTLGQGIARLGVFISGVGFVFLLMSVVGSIGFELSSSARLAWSRADWWDIGMTLALAGSVLGGVSMLRAHLTGSVAGAMIVAAGVVLVIALFVPFVGPQRITEYALAADGSRMLGVETAIAAQSGWFTTNPVVALAGVAFGFAWAVLGIGESRTGSRPRRSSAGIGRAG